MSQIIYDFIKNPNEEERVQIAKNIANVLRTSLHSVIDVLVEKEGKRGDSRSFEFYKNSFGKDSILLAFHILDEMMIKECQTHSINVNGNCQEIPDFSQMFSKEIFLKAVFACSIESILFVNIVKSITV